MATASANSTPVAEKDLLNDVLNNEKPSHHGSIEIRENEIKLNKP